MTSPVRPEYAALAGEFGELAADFGHRIETALRRDIARLAAAIECIDRHVDDIDDESSRRAMWSSVLHLLEVGDRPSAVGPVLADELAASTLDLRELALRRGVLARIVRIVAKEVLTSEAMRTTTSPRVYIGAVLREGRLTTALALVVAGRECGPAFRRFFFRLGGPANVVDKLKDARGDHARGEIALRPGLVLFGRLAGALVLRVPALLFSHPRWLRVVRLGMRYLGSSPSQPAAFLP